MVNRQPTRCCTNMLYPFRQGLASSQRKEWRLFECTNDDNETNIDCQRYYHICESQGSMNILGASDFRKKHPIMFFLYVFSDFQHFTAGTFRATTQRNCRWATCGLLTCAVAPFLVPVVAWWECAPGRSAGTLVVWLSLVRERKHATLVVLRHHWTHGCRRTTINDISIYNTSCFGSSISECQVIFTSWRLPEEKDSARIPFCQKIK